MKAFILAVIAAGALAGCTAYQAAYKDAKDAYEYVKAHSGAPYPGESEPGQERADDPDVIRQFGVQSGGGEGSSDGQ